MPVKWLLFWQPTAGTAVSSQTLVDVTNCIESINGVKTGRWQTTASHYRPMMRDQSMPVECARELLGVTFSEHAGKYFFVLRNEHMVVEADSTMQDIMEKLQCYANRLTLVFQGYQYQLGDFQLKAGRAILAYNETLRGIVLEVEYVPLCSLELARLAMQEFVAMWKDVVADKDGLGGFSFTGQFVPLELNYNEYNLGDTYGWQHTALQYVSLMALLMSQTARIGI